MLRVSWTSAALLTGYSQRPVWATLAEIDVKLTIAPPPRATRCGWTAFAVIAALATLTFSDSSQSSREEAKPSST